MARIGKYLFLTGLVLLLLIINPLSGFCQGDPGCDPLDPACPIDGGVSLLIAAGIGLAARKAYKHKKEESDISESK